MERQVLLFNVHIAMVPDEASKVEEMSVANVVSMLEEVFAARWWESKAVCGAIFAFGFWNMIITSMLGIYFLVERVQLSSQRVASPEPVLPGSSVTRQLEEVSPGRVEGLRDLRCPEPLRLHRPHLGGIYRR
jgi:hypothetical protein